MKNTIAETLEISVAVSVSHKNFNFVVAAFSKSVGNRRRKSIENTA